MKRFLLLTTFLLTLFSCSNDMEFNDHVFQVSKNSEFWKASDFSITINEDGFLSIVGALDNEVITLNLTSTEPGIYDLNAGSNNTAWYKDANGLGFTSEYQGDGEVVIEKYDPLEQTFTGTFRFNAFSRDGAVANFVNGVFYRIPLVTEEEIEDLSVLNASINDSDFVADTLSAVKREGMIEVEGFASDGSFVKIMLPETITSGSFNLTAQSVSDTYAVYGFANGITSAAQYGTLFIHEHDISGGLIKGTFVFTTLLPNSVLVDNGSFTVYY